MSYVDELFNASEYRLKVQGMSEDFCIKFLQFNEDENNPLLEEYDKKAELKFTAEILDQDKFIKKNELMQVSNPTFFVRNGVPTEDGLLSNKIFGITMEERSGTFAYIDLYGTYIDPSVYKAMITGYYSIAKPVLTEVYSKMHRGSTEIRRTNSRYSKKAKRL